MSGYVGRGIEYGNAVADHFTGNGGATYTLSYDTVTNGVVVSLDGVVQKNGTDFNVTGTSLVFTSTVANPIAIQVIYTGLTLTFPTPADNSVTLAKMAGGTDGQIITYDASGDPVAVGPGSDGQVLTSTGAGSPPAFEAIPSDITKQGSDPTISTNPSGGVGTMILNTSSGKLFICTDATAGANVWQAGVDGSVAPFTSATGGTITTSGDYKIHTFTSSGNFVVSSSATDVEYLVVAGGGGGGSFGGGGAGGYRTGTGFSVSSQTYAITVGAGGADAPSATNGSNGGDSVFSTITSSGGGGGGGLTNTTAEAEGQDGGSGGGGGCHGSSPYAGQSGGSGNTPSTSPSQGNNGGAGVNTATISGGGGGAGAVGGTGSGSTAGIGGAGTANSITGSSVTYSGGGGGCSYNGTPGPGGAGGGGNGGTGGGAGNNSPTTGSANTGGGGGGMYGYEASDTGNGGSGIVILKYKFQ